MKKHLITAISLLLCAVAFAQEEKLPMLKGLNAGLGIPFECSDLKAAGADLHIGFDYAYPINPKLAMGFYLSGGGGFLGEIKQQYKYDTYYSVIKISAGILVEFGDLNNKPYIAGFSPCAGFALVDLDMTLPIEVRFGKFITNRWYIVGEFVYGISLAKETLFFEPSVRVGYNFGRKKK